MPDRSFLTNIRIMVHTLSSAILQRIPNPWNLPSEHPMHSATPASTHELQLIINELHDIHQMSSRLVVQSERSLALLSSGESQGYSSSLVKGVKSVQHQLCYHAPIQPLIKKSILRSYNIHSNFNQHAANQ